MLRGYWRGPADASVPSSAAPNPAAVHLQALLSGVAKRPPPCIWPLGGQPHVLPVQPLGGQPCGNLSSMVLLGSASDHLTVIPLSSVHACMPALILLCLLLPLHLQYLSLSQKLRRSARLAAKCVPAPQSCSPQCHPVLLRRRKRPLIRPVYPPLKRLRLVAGDALHVLARASAFSRLACPALHFVAVSSSGCISLANVRLVHDPCGGVADCYFAQGLPWLIPFMPRDASHAFIH